MKKMNPLTEKDQKAYAAGADAFLEKWKAHEEENARKAEEEHKRKLKSGELIEVNGKFYDTRYYKG